MKLADDGFPDVHRRSEDYLAVSRLTGADPLCAGDLGRFVVLEKESPSVAAPDVTPSRYRGTSPGDGDPSGDGWITFELLF